MQKRIVLTRSIIFCCVIISMYFIFTNSDQKSDMIVMDNTVYVPKNDGDFSGDESFYNDPELFISTEPNGTRVASCRGCHFECKHCEE